MTQVTNYSKQQRIAKGIMIILSVLATLAGLAALADLSSTTEASRVVETWRMIGFFTFAGLFAMLADHLTRNKELWVIVILNKLALTIAGLYYLPKDYPGATDLITFDGSITVLLIVASILAGVWRKLPNTSK